MVTTPIQDTLSFSLRADTVVVSDTVRVSVTINTISSDDKSEETLRSEIKTALSRLIPDAVWKFSNLTRAEDATGYERVSLTASTRVSEKENVKLDDRAKKASIQGLTLSDVTVDATVPGPMLETAERKLRLEIVKKALAELKEINEATERSYRLGSISYGSDAPYGGGKMASTNSPKFYSAQAGGGAEDDDGSLSNSQRVTVSASITFATLVSQ